MNRRFTWESDNFHKFEDVDYCSQCDEEGSCEGCIHFESQEDEDNE